MAGIKRRRALPGEIGDDPIEDEGFESEEPSDIRHVKAYYNIDDFAYRTWSDDELREIRREAANTVVDDLGDDDGEIMSNSRRRTQSRSSAIEWQLADDLRDGDLPLFERMPQVKGLVAKLARKKAPEPVVSMPRRREKEMPAQALPELREATVEVVDEIERPVKKSAEATAKKAATPADAAPVVDEKDSARNRLRALAMKGVSDG